MRILLSCLILIPLAGWSQQTLTPNDVEDQRSRAYALTGATLHIDPDTTIEQGTLLIRDGRIEATRSGNSAPDGYVEIDVSGRHIYPGLIDLYSHYGLPEAKPRKPFSFSEAEVLASQTQGAYSANQAIRSEYRAVEEFTRDNKTAETYRKLGFGAVLTLMPDGIARGTSALVSLGGQTDNEAVLSADAAAQYSFDKGSSEQAYPISPMGSIALLRQTYLDANWYQQQDPRPFTDLSLAAWNQQQNLPQIFEAGDWLSVLRADEVGDEFGVQFVIKSDIDAYQRADAIKATNATLIIDLDFPKAQSVDDPFDSHRVSLTDLKHWELAPANAAALADAGVRFAITSDGSQKTFWKNLSQAMKHGLDERTALAALTTVPAQVLGIEDQLGSLQDGSLANFLVTSGPLFESGSMIEENWIQGRQFQINPHHVDHSGRYQISLDNGQQYLLEVSGKPAKPKAELVIAKEADSEEDSEEKLPAEISFERGLVNIQLSPAKDEPALRLSGWIEAGQWSGRAQLPDGNWSDWQAEPQPPEEQEEGKKKNGDGESEIVSTVTFPFSPYGWEDSPEQSSMLFKGATVWTLDGDGVIEDADVLVVDGKISAVGQNLSNSSATVIDAQGMHLTPGIIDEHSHIALSGVNDVATNSGMVRMNDVVNSEDINIYRNLAGGVTAAQLLHGSANPIGGQSAIVKLRWGALPREMLIDGAAPFIKFALGENVKRSRNPNSVRYPQTRMGVEQVYRNAFSKARDYERDWQAYNALSRRQQQRTAPPRRDLAMDTMVEILNGDRFISSHSYVQSEINMLMKVAEEFGFRINTFTHILEGYKVADIMAEHGAGGSTFADWWAYKWEVRYAIPYNPALMQQAGVVVAVNSDSSEMSRRLNQEAAKSVKYGDMSEVDALKLVTLNPAKLLHLDDRMGSIEVGKDADLVLWTDHPLSIYAAPDKTIVDGRILFDRQTDQALRERIKTERAALIEKMRKANGNGGGR